MAVLDLREFLATGEFAGLTSNSDRDELHRILGEPDAVGGTTRKHPVPLIWNYGGVEFHFGIGSPSTLWLLFFDYPDLPPAGNPRLLVKPWIVRAGLTLEELQSVCNEEGISLKKVQDLGAGEECWETEGGVILVFSSERLEAVSRRY